jgi:hypothetical protein
LVSHPGQILGHAADAEPGRVHAKSRDGLDHVVGFLPVGEHEEDRRHRAHVLDVSAEEQQMRGDAEEFHHHHADGLDPIRHLDAGEFFHRQHIRQVVHHPTQVIDAVGVGNEGVPGLALGHLFRATMVVADVRHRIEYFLAVELQNRCGTRRARTG